MILIATRIREFLTHQGTNPFRAWLATLSPEMVAMIHARLRRVSLGNFCDFRSVGHGMLELRIDIGPGLRVYFGKPDPQTIVILLGGSKSHQKRVILAARRYWLEYLGREVHGS